MSRGHPGVIRADIPAQNFGQGPQNPVKTSIWARTSMTRRRGRPRPQGIFKNFGQKNFGLNFRSLPCGIHPFSELPKLCNPSGLQGTFFSTSRRATIQPKRTSLVAQCSATPATVAATPPCSATPFQTPKFRCDTSRHRGGEVRHRNI